MAERVTVALLGNPEHAFGNAAFTWHEGGAEELDLPWDALPKVELEVEDGDTLFGVLSEALRKSGVTLPHWVDPDDPPLSWITFRRGDEQPSYRLFLSKLDLVEDDGRVRWNVPYKDVTYGQLRRAAGGGTIPGDPRQMYLILLPPQGDGVLLTWSTLLEGLRIAREVLDLMATVGGAAAFAKLLLAQASQRLGRGREVLQDRYMGWDERGAAPLNFGEFLSRGPWHGADLSERLGCSQDEAAAILWAFGYAPAESGLWRRDADDAAALLHKLSDDLVTTSAWNPTHNFEREMKRRATGLLERGEPLPEPSHEHQSQADEDEASESESLIMGSPVAGISLQCQCGREDCHAALEFYRSGFGDFDHVVLTFSPETDHFAMDPAVLGAVLGSLARWE